MEEKKGKSNIVTVLLLIIIVILAVALYLSLTGKITLSKSENENTETTENTKEKINYTFKEIQGLYTFSEKIKIDDEELEEGFNLLLNADGTYFYAYTLRVGVRHAGNYIIEDNKILLNKLFSVTDGPGTSPSYGTISLTINQNKTITYDNPRENKESIILVKTPEEETNKFIQKFGANKETILENSYYTNKITKAQNN